MIENYNLILEHLERQLGAESPVASRVYQLVKRFSGATVTGYNLPMMDGQISVQNRELLPGYCLFKRVKYPKIPYITAIRQLYSAADALEIYYRELDEQETGNTPDRDLTDMYMSPMVWGYIKTRDTTFMETLSAFLWEITRTKEVFSMGTKMMIEKGYATERTLSASLMTGMSWSILKELLTQVGSTTMLRDTLLAIDSQYATTIRTISQMPDDQFFDELVPAYRVFALRKYYEAFVLRLDELIHEYYFEKENVYAKAYTLIRNKLNSIEGDMTHRMASIFRSFHNYHYLLLSLTFVSQSIYSLVPNLGDSAGSSMMIRSWQAIAVTPFDIQTQGVVTRILITNVDLAGVVKNGVGSDMLKAAFSIGPGIMNLNPIAETDDDVFGAAASITLDLRSVLGSIPNYVHFAARFAAVPEKELKRTLSAVISKQYTDFDLNIVKKNNSGFLIPETDGLYVVYNDRPAVTAAEKAGPVIKGVPTFPTAGKTGILITYVPPHLHVIYPYVVAYLRNGSTLGSLCLTILQEMAKTGTVLGREFDSEWVERALSSLSGNIDTPEEIARFIPWPFFVSDKDNDSFLRGYSKDSTDAMDRKKIQNLARQGKPFPLVPIKPPLSYGAIIISAVTRRGETVVS